MKRRFTNVEIFPEFSISPPSNPFLSQYIENDDTDGSDNEIITSNESISKTSHPPNKLELTIFLGAFGVFWKLKFINSRFWESHFQLFALCRHGFWASQFMAHGQVWDFISGISHPSSRLRRHVRYAQVANFPASLPPSWRWVLWLHPFFVLWRCTFLQWKWTPRKTHYGVYDCYDWGFRKFPSKYQWRDIQNGERGCSPQLLCSWCFSSLLCQVNVHHSTISFQTLFCWNDCFDVNFIFYFRDLSLRLKHCDYLTVFEAHDQLLEMSFTYFLEFMEKCKEEICFVCQSAGNIRRCDAAHLYTTLQNFRCRAIPEAKLLQLMVNQWWGSEKSMLTD